MRRSGMTLIEVLVAIFVMGLGLIAILALFPIGVLRMAQAIQENRIGNIAKTADSIAATLPRPMWNTAVTYAANDQVYFKGTCYSSKVASNSGNQPDVSPTQWSATSMNWGIRNEPRVITDPAMGTPTDAFSAPATSYTADPNGQSFPVFVDPTGYEVSGESAVAGAGWVRRRSVSCVVNAPSGTRTQAAVRWFTFLDDIYFNVDGTAPASFNRDYRYSWAYMLQRPTSSDPTVVDMKVVVFNKRSLALTSGLTLPETLYDNAVFDFARNVVSIDWSVSGIYPQVRPGGWILDATPLPVATPPYTSANAYFYRVVAINDVSATTVELEVQIPFRGSQVPSPRQVIIMEGVAEVFDRGTGK